MGERFRRSESNLLGESRKAMHNRAKGVANLTLKTNIDKKIKDGLTPIFENALRSRAHQPRSPCSASLLVAPRRCAVATARV